MLLKQKYDRLVVIFFILVSSFFVTTIQAEKAKFLPPRHYYDFNQDSPFKDLNFHIYLENFEDHKLDTPGVQVKAIGGKLSSSEWSGEIIDSVDADDGRIDGPDQPCKKPSGDCDSYWADGPSGITFSFDPVKLGGYPTHVGVVWTDGAGTIIFEAFDASGVSLGKVRETGVPDGNAMGKTGEDRFFGVIFKKGISAIKISNGSGGIEVDHLQYGVLPGIDKKDDKRTIKEQIDELAKEIRDMAKMIIGGKKNLKDLRTLEGLITITRYRMTEIRIAQERIDEAINKIERGQEVLNKLKEDNEKTSINPYDKKKIAVKTGAFVATKALAKGAGPVAFIAGFVIDAIEAGYKAHVKSDTGKTLQEYLEKNSQHIKALCELHIALSADWKLEYARLKKLKQMKARWDDLWDLYSRQ
jgi:hypothetical protein